jgi:hypothetical protein
LKHNENTTKYVYYEVSNTKEYYAVVQKNIETIGHESGVIMYNYHEATMPWLHRGIMAPHIKHVGIPHETTRKLFDAIIDIDPSSGSETSIPRPLLRKTSLNTTFNTPYTKEFVEYGIGGDKPIIGSFGFGFDNKGFHKIVDKVCKEYDEAIIKFVVPVSHFDPNREGTIRQLFDKCSKAKTKSDVKMMICTDFMSEEELMAFLGSNTLNLFMYDKLQGRGISSAIDYAISAGKSLGISTSKMFRHIWCKDIDAETKTCEELIVTGSEWVNGFDFEVNNIILKTKIETILKYV